MKRIVTILLLAMLLFNWIGYRLFTAYIENRSDRQFEAQLDNNNYDETQLISIKVPVAHLAYYNISKNFERMDGQIEANGVVYKYVKRRIFNDSLEVLCIPNKTAMQLNAAKNEFFKLVNDLQANNQTRKANSHKNFSKAFSTDNCTTNDVVVLSELNESIPRPLIPYSENLASSFSFINEQPPDFLS
ncbi:MAG: hypothetical protein JST87_03515 [Bacteroidetes bacterium]|nr:hypothetical protein [Bacteroidota bacterium]MBS1934094.1 hypothetical protein [Bacteroidota bacterium]